MREMLILLALKHSPTAVLRPVPQPSGLDHAGSRQAEFRQLCSVPYRQWRLEFSCRHKPVCQFPGDPHRSHRRYYCLSGARVQVVKVYAPSFACFLVVLVWFPPSTVESRCPASWAPFARRCFVPILALQWSNLHFQWVECSFEDCARLAWDH